VFSVNTSFRLEPGRIERMLRLPDGMVYRNMERRVRRVEAEARRLAPGSMGRGNNLRVALQRGPGGEFRGVVSVHHPAVLYVLFGARPHLIRPIRAQALRFTVGGRVVYAKLVHHPGYQGRNFLAMALRSAL
jgi:hypothetical protein